MFEPQDLRGPAIVVLCGEERTPLPVDDLRVDGDALVGLLDGREHRWRADAVHSFKYTEAGPGGWRAASSRARWPRHLAHDEALAMLRMRPASLAGTREKDHRRG